MELTQVAGDWKLDDMYNLIKSKGRIKKYDGKQLFKMLADYDNNGLSAYN